MTRLLTCITVRGRCLLTPSLGSIRSNREASNGYPYVQQRTEMLLVPERLAFGDWGISWGQFRRLLLVVVRTYDFKGRRTDSKQEP